MEEEKRKSQKRAERQRRREERRTARLKSPAVSDPGEAETKKRKSLPGFLAKYRRELSEWLWHYMILIVKAEDAGIPYIREMPRERRDKLVQEYVDVAEFRMALDQYLKEEAVKSK